MVSQNTQNQAPKWAMVSGILAAVAASLCCAGPLVLLVLGVSGSWISSLTALDPYRPYFMGLVILIFVWSGWRVYRPINSCPKEGVCAKPENRRRYQWLFWMALLIALTLVFSPYWLVWII